jgi:SAM-dependent methyltransferase
MGFDPKAYWEQRLANQYSAGGVGYLGLTDSYNEWMYRVRRHVFLREVRRLGRPPTRVLDVGSGTGFYIACWHELGATQIVGSDLTDVATRNLAQRFPSDTFARFDVGGEELLFEEERFDAVSAMDVLFHIVDDDRFRRAFTNVFALLEPGGTFVVAENFLHRKPVRVVHQVSRTLGEIEGAAIDAGFQIVRRRPMFCLMNAPIDSESRLRQEWWARLRRATSGRQRAGTLVGAVLYPIELALVSVLREGPSTEVMICTKPA